MSMSRKPCAEGQGSPPGASSALAPTLDARPSSRGSLRRYLTIYAALWKNSIVREMGFKANFLLWIVVEMLWFALQLSFMFVIYSHTDRIGTWSKWQVVMLLGASHFIQQIFTAIFLTNCTQLSELIRTGKLDFMLLLPVNTRFMISFRQVDLGGFVNAASGVAVMIYAGNQLGLSPGWAQVAGFVLLAAVSILVHYSLMFLLASVSFWTVRAQGIVWGYYNLFNIARMPDEAFRGLFKVVFTFALPMLVLLAMGVVCFLISEWGWRASLKRYTSASS